MSDLIQAGFERGRRDYCNGKPRPKSPPEDGSVTSPDHTAWYGWMVERAIQWMRARDTYEMLTGRDDFSERHAT